MSKKKPLTPELQAECRAANALFLAKKNELKLSQKKIADAVGISPAGVAQYLNGTNPLNAKFAAAFSCLIEEPVEKFSPRLAAEIAKIARSAAEPAKKIESNVEPGPPITSPWRAIPIVGTAQMGTEGYWHALESADGYVDVPSRDKDAYALRLKGNSMAPAIKSGWVAVIEPSGLLIPGEYVMVRLIDEECMLKELLYVNDVEVSLASVNDAYERRTIPVEQIELIHHVGHICPPSKVRV